MGNMDLFAPCLLMAVLPLIFFAQTAAGKPVEKPKHSAVEQKRKLEKLASLLLDATDNETDKRAASTVTYQLAREIKMKEN